MHLYHEGYIGLMGSYKMSGVHTGLCQPHRMSLGVFSFLEEFM